MRLDRQGSSERRRGVAEMTRGVAEITDNLVKRLRDRIEKLEAALRELSDGWECCPVSQAMRRVAREALEGKDE